MFKRLSALVVVLFLITFIFPGMKERRRNYPREISKKPFSVRGKDKEGELKGVLWKAGERRKAEKE